MRNMMVMASYGGKFYTPSKQTRQLCDQKYQLQCFSRSCTHNEQRVEIFSDESCDHKQIICELEVTICETVKKRFFQRSK